MSICVSEEKKDVMKPLINQRAPLEERFDIIIEDTDLYTAFEAFLVTQFSQENLHFYHDVCKFHDLTDQEEITTAAQQLCTKYLGHGGNDLVLNLDTLVAQQILGGLQKPTSTMFDMAYHDVEQILKTLYLTFIGDTVTLPKPKKTGFTLSCVDTES